MSRTQNDPLETLIHDVNSKCASLKSAAALLRGLPSPERRELLALMVKQAQSLARSIADLNKGRRAK